MLNVFLKKLSNKSNLKIWIRLVITSWIVAFILVFISLIFILTTLDPLAPSDSMDWMEWLFLIPIIAAFLITGIPVLVAIFHPFLRNKVYAVPSATAVSLFIFSFLISAAILVGIETILGLTDIDTFIYNRKISPNHFWVNMLMAIFNSFIIGIAIFPITFGLAFPFAIPVACAGVVWAIMDEDHKVSNKAWNILMTIATLGWMLVAVIGAALGKI